MQQYEMLKNYKDVLLVKDLIKILCISKNKAYKLVNTNVIPSFKIDNQIRITKVALLNYLNSCK